MDLWDQGAVERRTRMIAAQREERRHIERERDRDAMAGMVILALVAIVSFVLLLNAG